MSVRGVAARWSTTRSRCPTTSVTRPLGTQQNRAGATQSGWLPLGRTPIDMRITLDDHRPQRRHAMIGAIGNVGELAGNLTLLPDTRPDDGRLDVYVASPHRLSHWLRTFLRLVTRRPRADDRVDQSRATQVEVPLRHPDPYQLDGDVIGDCRALRAEVRPGP
jgi:diacylglycerol kinase (ATP)